MGIDAAAAEAEARARQLLVATAEQTYRDARFHKRASEHHRRQAVAARQRFENFCRDLKDMGIEVVIENISPENPITQIPKGYPSERRSNSDR